MREITSLVKEALRQGRPLPFSAYLSLKEQRILNAPIAKPLLILVLAGVKKLGREDEIVCPAGSFLFLPNTASIDMRNIPGEEYFAVLIEFDLADFDSFRHTRSGEGRHFQGPIEGALAKMLKQFVEWSLFAPRELWRLRRQELLQLLYLSGYTEVSRLVGHPALGHQLHEIISENIAEDWRVERLVEKLAVSESTLRRKLKAEGSSLRSVLDRARLGHGLFLVQTTLEPIGRIAERCGYQSQSRFTDKFKQQFGITPSELRKTRLSD
ncbi:helix-turn-helix transcriptional regulator [Pseudomonas sp. MRSN 12121]|uniref:helix-turn-helix transcriptional regulator n=1 Tax=Pseudomonas sp. MRSN 12121 TaxID=1611770 RepID=UPI0005BEC0AA|nr:helix-turn-helix transcriptional regulator [Pseudomonas sp. MRSN 12121]AJO78379.1 AraC family transcriptional regulator [Pseudomonas sp. MRSN 12121]